MNGHWRVVPCHHDSRTSFGKRDRLAAAEVHDEPARAVDPRAGPGDRAGKARAGERAAGHREIAGGLPVTVHAGETGDVVVECVGRAASRIEQHPEETAIVSSSPADVVEHHGFGQALGHEDPLHQLHGDQVSLVGLGAGDHDPAVSLGTAMGIEQALGEIAGRQELEEPELILPAHAIGLEFRQQVEHSQIAAELFAGGFRGEVGRILLVPMKDDAAVLDELECVGDALVGDRPACDRAARPGRPCAR